MLVFPRPLPLSNTRSVLGAEQHDWPVRLPEANAPVPPGDNGRCFKGRHTRPASGALLHNRNVAFSRDASTVSAGQFPSCPGGPLQLDRKHELDRSQPQPQDTRVSLSDIPGRLCPYSARLATTSQGRNRTSSQLAFRGSKHWPRGLHPRMEGYSDSTVSIVSRPWTTSSAVLNSQRLSSATQCFMLLNMMLPTQPQDIKRLGVVFMVGISLFTTDSTGFPRQHTSCYPCFIGFRVPIMIILTLGLDFFSMGYIEAVTFLNIPFRMSLATLFLQAPLAILATTLEMSLLLPEGGRW